MSAPVIIIGAGPAGMSAALELAKAKQPVIVLDEQPHSGGQIYRNLGAVSSRQQQALGKDYMAGAGLSQEFAQAVSNHTIDYRSQAKVWGLEKNQLVTWTEAGTAKQSHCQALILATGALERPVPVPGWTLPGVLTAGAGQIMLKNGAEPFSDAVLVGTGPLLYLLAKQMIALGKPPKAIVETQVPRDLLGALWHWPRNLAGQALLWQGLGMLAQIKKAGVKRIKGVTSLQLLGDKQVTGVRYVQAGKTAEISASHVLLHAGIVPNLQYTQALDLTHNYCQQTQALVVQRDHFGRTDLPWVYVAGDGSQIMGAKAAAVDGRLVGQLALLEHYDIHDVSQLGKTWQAKLKCMQGRAFIDRLYKPAQWLLAPTDDTIVCRCESVTADEVRQLAHLCQGPNQLKAYSRVGMGSCQGRYCGGTVVQLLAQVQKKPVGEVGYYRIRSPLKPLSLGELASLDVAKSE